MHILAQRHGIGLTKPRCLCNTGAGVIHGQNVLLCQPQTYMNESGRAVVSLINWYKAEHTDLILVYDDIDLPLWRLRVRPSGSAGTHNGMRSIIYLTGAEDYARVRVGIGRPGEGRDLRAFVTGHYSAHERAAAFAALMRAAEAVECIIAHGVEKAMAQYNAGPPAAG